MNHLWTAAEEYHARAEPRENDANVEASRDAPANMCIEMYSGKLHDALERIQRAQIALDGAGIDVEDVVVRREIQNALRCAKRAADIAEKRSESGNISGANVIFASVFRTNVHALIADLFDAIVQRKELSRVSILST